MLVLGLGLRSGLGIGLGLDRIRIRVRVRCFVVTGDHKGMLFVGQRCIRKMIRVRVVVRVPVTVRIQFCDSVTGTITITIAVRRF